MVNYIAVINDGVLGFSCFDRDLSKEHADDGLQASEIFLSFFALVDEGVGQAINGQDDHLGFG